MEQPKLKEVTLALIIGLIGFSGSFEYLAPTASASSTTQPFLLGFDDDQAPKSSSNLSWWNSALRDSRGGAYRFRISWSVLAKTKPADATNPDDPAYHWGFVDRAARVASQAGMSLLFSNWSAPRWAEGPNRPTTGYGISGREAPLSGSWDPNPLALKQFAIALARRYDGTHDDPLSPGEKLPKASMYEAWNEPNLKAFLSPQYETSKGAKRLVAIEKYRTLLNAFYDGIKSVRPDATVSVGGLGPYGSSSQGKEIEPQAFQRALLCLGGTLARPKTLKCPTKAKFDAFSIHPYTFFGTPRTRAYSRDGGAFGNTPDFKKSLDTAVARKTILPAGEKELWATEFGWITNPPGRFGGGNSFGVAPTVAAQYVSEGIYRLWSWGVTKAFHFLVRDDPDFPAGVYFWPNGATNDSQATPKPGLRAFQFPFIVIGQSPNTKAWGLSPCTGDGASVRIEASVRGRWLPIGSFSPDDHRLINQNVTVPAAATRVRGISTGEGCSYTSVSMPIYSK